MNKELIREFFYQEENQKILNYPLEKMDEILNSAPELKLVAVTGTVGKTTVVELLYDTFIALNKPTMVIGTNGVYCAHGNFKHQNFPSTSPATRMQLFLFMLGAYEFKCEYLILETTAETMFMNIYKDLRFESLSINNLKRDLVRSFKTDDEYVNAKRKLVLENKINHVICNRESNEYYNCIITNSNLITYNPYLPYTLGADGNLEIYFRDSRFSTGLCASINCQNLACYLNTLAVLGLFDGEVVANVLKNFVSAGRFETFEVGGRTVVVDTYYGGVMGMASFLEETCHLFKRNVAVCSSYYFGNSNDSSERMIQHRIARAKLVCDHCGAENVIITATLAKRGDIDATQPGRENEVIKQLSKGAPGAKIIYGRIDAISEALKITEPGDRILILGMGTETWATYNDQPVSDRKVVEILGQNM